MKEYHPGLEGYHPGLEGVIATESSISDINGEKGILSYRGYSIEDLAKKTSFEETSYLLLTGDLPSKSCLLYTSPSPRDATLSRMPSSA